VIVLVTVLDYDLESINPVAVCYTVRSLLWRSFYIGIIQIGLALKSVQMTVVGLVSPKYAK